MLEEMGQLRDLVTQQARGDVSRVPSGATHKAPEVLPLTDNEAEDSTEATTVVMHEDMYVSKSIDWYDSDDKVGWAHGSPTRPADRRECVEEE